jgi:hypothetical protein
MQESALELRHRAERGVAEPGGVRDDGVEDRLRVGRRARDHLEDLGRGRLLLEHALAGRLESRPLRSLPGERSLECLELGRELALGRRCHRSAVQRQPVSHH